MPQKTSPPDTWTGYDYAVLYLKKEYSRFSSKPCPICDYENGLLVGRCAVHKEIDNLQEENTVLKENKAEVVNSLRGWAHSVTDEIQKGAPEEMKSVLGKINSLLQLMDPHGRR